MPTALVNETLIYDVIKPLSEIEKEQAEQQRYNTTHSIISREVEVLREREDCIMLIERRQITGLNAVSGKRYYRWVKPGFRMIKKTKAGNFILVSRGLDMKQRYSNLYTGYAMGGMLRDAAICKWGDELKHDNMYPLQQHYRPIPIANNNVYFTSDCTIFQSMLRYKTVSELTAAIFGKKNMRRDLVKAVANSTLQAILYASFFKGLVPIDWIINFLRKNTRDSQGAGQYVLNNLSRNHVSSVKRALCLMGRKQYRRMLNIEFSERQQSMAIRFMTDAAALTEDNYFQTPPHFDDVKTPEDWHGVWLYGSGANMNRMRRNPDYVLPPRAERTAENVVLTPSPLSVKISGQVVKDYSIVIPEDSDTLRHWGREMNNCIGSYGNADYAHKMTLGAIYEHEKIIACFEVSRGRLNQLLGNHNSTLSLEKRKPLEQFFTAFGVEVTKYWGSE